MSSQSSLKLDLNKLAGIIHPFLLTCYHDYLDGKIYSYDLVGIFILSFISIKKPRAWCNGKLKTMINNKDNYSSSNLCNYPQLISWLHIDYLAKNLKCSWTTDMISSLTIVDIFNQLKFKGIKDNNDNYVNVLIVEWALNKVPFELLFYIPTSIQVLAQQSIGKRVITMFYTLSELSQKHHSNLTYMSGMQIHSRDALEFLLHDMKHMDHFHSPVIYSEQVGFFKCLYQLNHNNIQEYFATICELDGKFWFELEYVISDMYLYAKVFDAVKRKLFLTNHTLVLTPVEVAVDVDCDTQDIKKAVEEDSDNQDIVALIHKAMIDMWSKILQDMGMLLSEKNVCDDSSSEDVATLYASETGMLIERCYYEAYHISMDLIAVTHKEREEWSESEGNIIRQFFQYNSVRS